MKRFALLAILMICASPVAFAMDPTCDAQAAEKKLAGAAKASNVKKCTSDAVGT